MKQKRRVHSVGAPRFPSTSQETIENDQAVPTGVRELKLLDYKYDESRDIVLWKVEDFTPGNSPEMRVYALAFPSSDIGRQYGFSEHLPKKAIIAFCETVKNRTETFKNAYFTTAKRADAEWIKKAESPDELLKAHDEFCQYPFREVQEIIAEEDEERMAS